MLNIAQDVGKKQAGVTYAIRTDVMYRRLPKEHDDRSGVLFTSNGSTFRRSIFSLLRIQIRS